MKNQRNRIILDTNLWISFLLTKEISKLDLILSNKKVVLIFSMELLEELMNVTQRPKFKKYFDLKDVEKLLGFIRKRAEFVKVKTEVKICRDSKDDFLLALAVASKASHLITGDIDLLFLKNIGTTKILSIRDYLS